MFYFRKYFVLICFKIQFQLRQAIEDVNSGKLKPKDNSIDPIIPVTPVSPVCEPLLPRLDFKVQDTVTSLDSALSNSEHCSDIELDSISTRR